MSRVLPLKDIPNELWSDTVLKLPPNLAEVYENKLDELGHLKEAKQHTEKKGIHGGESVEESMLHFTHRFGASSSRVEFVTLAPDEALSNLSDALLSTFSEGHVALLDIPCGTGASSLALITTLCALRKDNIIPALPLTISITAGDFSDSALEVYDSLMLNIQGFASLQAISIRWETKKWDATRGDHTASMIDSWFSFTDGATEYVVTIVNFSGDLSHLLEAAQPSFEQILARLHDKVHTVLWVEPSMKSVKKMFGKVFNFFKTRIPWLIPATVDAPAIAEYRMQHPIKKVNHRVNVTVQHFIRKDPQ